MTAVAGWAGNGFEPVRAAFEENFLARDELGAAFAVYLDGEPVVDLWGGLADRASGRPWGPDTVQLLFSGTKGLVATCVLLLLDRGRLDLHAPVGRYWPEFAAAGKEAVQVADLVAHTARLPGLEQEVTVDEALDARLMATYLALQRQSEDPRAAACYHPLTFGWLVGELIRRIDGRSVGRFFADEVARPLALDAWIGLPADELPRVATIEPPAGADEGAHDLLYRQVWANPPVWEADDFAFNRADLLGCELAGVNGVGAARSIARLYGCLARGGTLGGIRLASPEAVALGRRVLSGFDDPLTGVPVAFGAGFRLATGRDEYGPVDDAFGHTGAGGSVHGAWPGRRIGFSYAMNRMRSDAVDPRAAALLEALASVTEDVPVAR